jgi:hypothetical protein
MLLVVKMYSNVRKTINGKLRACVEGAQHEMNTFAWTLQGDRGQYHAPAALLAVHIG